MVCRAGVSPGRCGGQAANQSMVSRGRRKVESPWSQDDSRAKGASRYHTDRNESLPTGVEFGEGAVDGWRKPPFFAEKPRRNSDGSRSFFR
ncbi:hypothetical protein A33M_4312 [Rhodovulum sp. PH10]|nr:hypothetical protein A33M_4312 [Rhodovulum sp. PH10]